MSRLPIQHPDFRYATSGNPYASKFVELPGRAFSDNDSEVHRGEWRAVIAKLEGKDRAQKSRSLHLEIGCNGGHVALEWAARDPKGAYLGLDWKYKQIIRAAEKAKKREINNVAFMRAYAERLEFMFAEGEIDHLYLYFPDPWPKKGHWKNRYITAESLRTLAKIVAPGGSFHIKTDHPGYFEWMEEHLSKVQDVWEVTRRSTDLHAEHPEPTKLEIPDVTLFEKLFIQKGIKIHSLWLKRR